MAAGQARKAAPITTVPKGRLRDAIDEVVRELRRRNPDGFAREPLPAGSLAPDVSLTPDVSSALFRLAFVEEAGDGDRVVWVDGDDELLVHSGAVRLVLRDGFALVGVRVYTRETKDAEVVVPFALGRPGVFVGLMMATEPAPRGPAIVVERWGDHLTAAAWRALLKLASTVAAAAGVDDGHQALRATSLAASRVGLTVTPQALHAFERRLASGGVTTKDQAEFVDAVGWTDTGERPDSVYTYTVGGFSWAER